MMTRILAISIKMLNETLFWQCLIPWLRSQCENSISIIYSETNNQPHGHSTNLGLNSMSCNIMNSCFDWWYYSEILDS